MIELDWHGPYSLETISKIGPSFEARCRVPGVYAWHYPKKFYGKAGFYFGTAKNIADRIDNHFRNTLAGYYVTPHRERCSIEKEHCEYWVVESISDLADKNRLKRLSELIFEIEFFYAECPNEIRHGVECALIRHLLDNVEKQGQFTTNSSLKGCRKPKTPVEIKNTGNPDMVKMLGETMLYQVG